MNTRRLCSVLLLITALCLAALAFAQDEDARPRPAVRSGMVVSAPWLAGHLADPKVIILHVAHKKADYDKAHIPGARFLAWPDFMVDRDGLTSELPSPEVLRRTFSSLGVSDGSHVVLYTTDPYPMAARAYYTLDYLGHGDHTSLLDGGLIQWQAEKRPISTDPAKITAGNFTPHVQPAVRALFAEAQAAARDPDGATALLDARPAARYTEGHLPGAVNIYWKNTLVDEHKSPVLLPPDKLRALFAAQGLNGDKKIVTYCEIGWQAAHMYFVARYLGYDAALFDGSFNEWDDVRHLPSVKGAKPQ